MEAGKLAIWPWLSCRYTKNTLMDKSCLVQEIVLLSILEHQISILNQLTQSCCCTREGQQLENNLFGTTSFIVPLSFILRLLSTIGILPCSFEEDSSMTPIKPWIFLTKWIVIVTILTGNQGVYSLLGIPQTF